MLKIDLLKRRIEKKIDIIKLVSFDVFDTLLIRLIPTETVSRLAAEKLSISLKQEIVKSISPNDILFHRFSFQRKIEKLKSRKEWSLSEWLSDLAFKNNIEENLLKKIGYASELDAEKRSLRMDENAKLAISIVKGYGLKTIALSDMWLDQELLKELLLDFGLSFDLVFSSASSVCSKKSGELFREVEKQVGAGPNGILHVGNKLRADYLSPKLRGWKSVWMPHWHSLFRMNVPQKVKKRILPKRPFEVIIQALEIPPCRIEPNPFYTLAYNYLSSILIIFSIVQWRKFRSQGISTVLYLARDAYLMMEAYDLMEDLLENSPKRHYIRLSRRAVAMAHPDNLLLNVEPLAGKIGKKTIGEWLSNFVLYDELYKNILADSGLKAESPFNDHERIILRKTCQKYRHVIEESQKEQISFIGEYIRSQTEGASIERVGVVDTGWACTIQDSIRRILDSKTQIVSGMYLGVSAQGKKPDQYNLKYGLLRDDFRNASHFNPLEATAGVIRMWDTLLREPAGSVSEIKRSKSGLVIPFMNSEAMIGPYEKKAAEKIIKGVHDGIVARRKGIASILDILHHMTGEDLETAAMMIARSVSLYPQRKIASMILRLCFDEGNAKGEVGTIGLKSLRKRVAWYPGILSDLGLGILSPLLRLSASVFLKVKKRVG